MSGMNRMKKNRSTWVSNYGCLVRRLYVGFIDGWGVRSCMDALKI